MFGFKKQPSESNTTETEHRPIKTVLPLPQAPKGMSKIVVYLDKKKEYRWRMVARNGKIVATSHESFMTKRNALISANGFVKLVPSAKVVEEK